MSDTTLVPGYRCVEAFGDDDEYERDENGEIIEEVEYVTLDLGVVEPTLVPSTSSYRLIGLDTPTPFLQLSGTIFQGKHSTLLGTELLFTDTQDDQQGRGKKSLIHVANTEKRIMFREVELKQKSDESAGPSEASAHERSSATSSKKRKPQTVEQLVGNEAAAEPSTRVRGGRRGRGGRKAKGKQRADAEPAANEHAVDPPVAHDDPMDTSGG